MQTALATVRHLKERYSQLSVQDKGKVFNTDLIFALELEYMLDVAETICVSGLTRKESRGAHFRTDMPDRDDENWAKHVLVSRGPEGPEIDYAPVSITRWPPEKRTY